MVSAAAPSIPQAFLDQLGDPGRMLIPVGTREMQRLVMVRKQDGEVTEETMRDAVTFVPLLGRYAWTPEGGEGAP